MKRRRLLKNLSAASVVACLPWTVSAQDTPGFRRVWVTRPRRTEHGFRFAVRGVADGSLSLRSGEFNVRSGKLTFRDGHELAISSVSGEGQREDPGARRTRRGPLRVQISLAAGERALLGHFTVPFEARDPEGRRRPTAGEFILVFDVATVTATLA